MALLPAWSLPILDIAQKHGSTVQAVRSNITKVDGEHKFSDHLASNAGPEEMRDVSSDSELQQNLQENKDMELNSRSHACESEEHQGPKPHHGITCLTESESDDQTDKVVRDAKDTAAKAVSREVESTSRVEVRPTELPEYECIHTADDILVASVVGAYENVAEEEKDDLEQQGQVHNTLAEAETGMVASVNSPEAHNNVENRRNYIQKSQDAFSFQVVPEAKSDTHQTETFSQDDCENNGGGAIHMSQEKVEPHLESSLHQPNQSHESIHRKVQEVEKPSENFPIPPADLTAKCCLLQRDSMEFQQLVSCEVLVSDSHRKVSAKEHVVPDDTSLCWTGQSDDHVEEDQCFYNETLKKTPPATDKSSPNFKWKYRPSFEETDETLTCPVEDDAGFTLGTVRPLPTASSLRSLRLGLSRKQKIRRLHTFKHE